MKSYEEKMESWRWSEKKFREIRPVNRKQMASISNDKADRVRAFLLTHARALQEDGDILKEPKG